MSATDDLREKLGMALYAHRLSLGDFPDGATAWNDLPEPWRDEWRDAADALMPTVREALADAWDEGYADGGHDEHEFRPGRRATNPWREADR